MSQPYRGVFTIPSTPFDERYQLDEAGLRRIVDFASAVARTAWSTRSMPAPFNDLDRRGARARIAHRRRAVRRAHPRRHRRGRRLQGTCSHVCPRGQGDGRRCRHRHDALPEQAHGRRSHRRVLPTPSRMRRRLPVFIQNHGVGSELSVRTMARVIREVEYVDYIKEETFPSRTSSVRSRCPKPGPSSRASLAARAGAFMLLEYPRGVAGQMPGCHVTDVVVRLWDALEAKEHGRGQARVWTDGAPLFAFETAVSRRGLQRSAAHARCDQVARSRNAVDKLEDAGSPRAQGDHGRPRTAVHLARLLRARTAVSFGSATPGLSLPIPCFRNHRFRLEEDTQCREDPSDERSLTWATR